MQTVGNADRYVIARENNVVLVDFRKTQPPAPDFPGAGALRVTKRINDEAGMRVLHRKLAQRSAGRG
jgi:hypothetical protein